MGSIQRRRGHSRQHIKDPEEAAARAQRAAKTRKRRAEIAEKEVEEKEKRLDDIGETADEIFYEAEAEALNVDEKDPEIKEELYGSHDQKTKNAEAQAPESRVKTQNAETQTTEFEYLFKQAVLQPFTEEYFANHDDRVRFRRVLMCSKQSFLLSVRSSLEGVKACLCFKNLL